MIKRNYVFFPLHDLKVSIKQQESHHCLSIRIQTKRRNLPHLNLLASFHDPIPTVIYLQGFSLEYPFPPWT